MVDRRPKVAIAPDLRDEIDAWKTKHQVRCRADAVAALVRRALLIEYAEESGIPVPTDEEILRVLLEQLRTVAARSSVGRSDRASAETLGPLDGALLCP
jgi:hypothetical protein